jgi:uncharacterized membrane protein
MAAIRAVYSGTMTNLFIYWNIFLALIAFAFIKLFDKLKKSGLSPKLKNLSLIMVFIGWLSLAPNAIYLVTDVGHLNPPRLIENSRYKSYNNKNVAKREVPYLYDIVMLFLLSLIGFISSGMLTNQMFNQLNKSDLAKLVKLNSSSEFLYLGLVSFATSVAIFLGRYLRWNSWDLIINPISILKDLFYYFANPSAQPNLYLNLALFFVLTATAHLFMRSETSENSM